MRFRTTFAKAAEKSTSANARQAARKIKADFADFPATLIIYFAATDYEANTLAVEMRDAFPGAKTFGCSTAGEQCDDRILNASVVAMAFSSEAFEYCETALVLAAGKTAPAEGVFDTAEAAMRHLTARLGVEPIHLDYRQYVGLMLGDSISAFTESVVEKIGELTDVIFVGGMAGDDYKFVGAQTVFYDGQVYRNAAVLALWKPKNGFSLLKTQAVEMTDRNLVITRADEENRIIWQFDGEDAAPAYARAIGIPVETMDILDYDENPLALTADGEPFLRAVVKKVDERGLQMFAQVREGTRQTLTRVGDILGRTKEDLDAAMREAGEVAAILHINCASRHTALKNKGQADAFGTLFRGVPNIAFFSYGEVYVGVVALTSTMILFK